MIFLYVVNRQGRLSLDSSFGLHCFRCRIDWWLLAKVLLHPEMDCHNDGNNGYGAEHQNRKQNLDHHRVSGYQNRHSAKLIFPAWQALTEPNQHSFHSGK
jgi:hypothetical protein